MDTSYKSKPWPERISRSGYFLGALLLHLVVFVMVAASVVFPAFHSPPEAITTTYLPSSPPPLPPPPSPAPQVPTHFSTTSPKVIINPINPEIFHVLVPNSNLETLTLDTPTHRTQPIMVKNPNSLSPERLKKILPMLEAAGRTPDDIRQSDGDPKNIRAKFKVYLASYADGDWNCNVITADGKLVAGSLPNFVAKIAEWSHGRITAEVVPTPLDIGGSELNNQKPPLIFFTGHKDFVLTEQEVLNLRDYLQMGGLIWGDNAEPGRGSRFDVAFRREMKRVVPDADKNFEPVAMTDDVFKSWYSMDKIPGGMNYYAEPLEHLDLDGKLAILYTPNDYSDMFCMRILPGDTEMGPTRPEPGATSPLVTSELFLDHSDVFFRNFKLPSCLACDQLGMNVIGYMLVRFDRDLLLTP